MLPGHLLTESQGLPGRGRSAGPDRQAGAPRPRHRRRRTGPRPGTGLHPVEQDPDLRDRLKAAAQADRVRREVGRTRTQGGAPQRHAGPRVRRRAGGAGGAWARRPRRVGAHRPRRDARQGLPRERSAGHRDDPARAARRRRRTDARRAGVDVRVRAPFARRSTGAWFSDRRRPSGGGRSSD